MPTIQDIIRKGVPMSTPRTSPSTRLCYVEKYSGTTGPSVIVTRMDMESGNTSSVRIPTVEAPFVACDILECATETTAVVSIDAVDCPPEPATGRRILRLRADNLGTLAFDLSAVATEQLIAALTPSVLTRLPDLAAGCSEQESAIEAVVPLTPPGPIAPDVKPSFWMVKGPGPTSHQHASEDSAWAEAGRLAIRSPGVAFRVLQTIGEAYAAPPPAPVVERIAHDPRAGEACNGISPRPHQ